MLDDVLRAMPPKDREPYEHLVRWEFQPAFSALTLLIDLSEKSGLVTCDEAALLRAGRPVDNPLPDIEGQGAGAGGGLG
jgi:hypothetical protein